MCVDQNLGNDVLARVVVKKSSLTRAWSKPYAFRNQNKAGNDFKQQPFLAHSHISILPILAKDIKNLLILSSKSLIIGNSASCPTIETAIVQPKGPNLLKFWCTYIR